MQDLGHSDGNEENMGLKTPDAMIKSQHDCLDGRDCQKSYIETQQNVQFVSGRHRIESFQTSFRNASECRNYRSEKNVEDG